MIVEVPGPSRSASHLSRYSYPDSECIRQIHSAHFVLPKAPEHKNANANVAVVVFSR